MCVAITDGESRWPGNLDRVGWPNVGSQCWTGGRWSTTSIGRGERQAFRQFARETKGAFQDIAAAIIAAATVGSALFGGVALADDDRKEGKKPASVSNTGGAGGAGGDVRQECDQDLEAFNVIFDSTVKDHVPPDRDRW
jgi:hypothetical protein